MEAVMSECTRNNTCYDCDYDRCWHAGKKSADCPKYKCDNTKLLDCENCAFIDWYITEMRNSYAMYMRK